jgi:hypothetical protein
VPPAHYDAHGVVQSPGFRMKSAHFATLLAVLLIVSPASRADAEAFQFDGSTITLSARGDAMRPDHNSLVISRAGRDRFRLTAASIEIIYRRSGTRGDRQPDLIVTGYAGGAHCCYTVHVIRIDGKVVDNKIPIRDSELELDRSTAPPRLRFYDFAFAYWKTSFAESPAPLVVLAWDAKTKSYRPDIAAMRQPAPDEAGLASSAQEVRGKLMASPPDRPDPALWARMLDLIYAGDAATAVRFFDLAWPPDRPGKREFLAEFTRQLKSGALWRRYGLGELLDADAVFH